MSSAGTLWALNNPNEGARFLAALMPRILFEISVPNQDCDGLEFPQLAHVAQFESLFSELCGGHAPSVGGSSRYQPRGEAGMSEYTVVLKTYLPEIVTDEMRQRLLSAIMLFGETTRQEVVLVAVGVFAFRFKFNARSQEQGNVA